VRKVSRREFIGTALIGGIVLAAAPGLLKGSESGSGVSRIVYVENPAFSKEMRINPEPLREAIDSLLMKLTDTNSISEAWKALLPGYEKGQVIGIKVNCINRWMPSHPEVVHALVESLLEFGVPENDIVIWDRRNDELERKAGYKLNSGQTGIRCFGTDEPGWGYDAENPVEVGGQTKHLSKIITRLCDHLINVPVLKDHGLAGVTLSMKNHYGTVENPGTLHGNNCDPFIAELNAVPYIRDKTRLILLAAILGICKGGPGGKPQFAPNILAVGLDPVAMDTFGLKLINEERKRRGLEEVTAKAKHIATAAKLGVGTDDESRIKLIRI